MKVKTLAAATILAALLAPGATALADETDGERTQPRKIEATYEVTWQGLPVFEAQLTIDVSLSSYRMRVDGRTGGLVSYVAPMLVNWRTAGRVVDGDFQPVVHVAERTVPHGRRSIGITYDRTGTISTQYQPPRDPDAGPLVPADLQADARDPLTALLVAAVRDPDAGACEALMQIYDGRRRIDVTLRDESETGVPAAFMSWFRAGAHRCAIGVSQRAPVEYVDRESAAGTTSGDSQAGPDLRLDPRNVTIARLQEGAIWVPIAAELGSSIGRLELRMTGIRVENRRLN